MILITCWKKLNFNNDFALPDKLVQDFVNDGSMMPSFKRSLFFNHADMEDLVKTSNHIAKNVDYDKTPPRKEKQSKKKENK